MSKEAASAEMAEFDTSDVDRWVGVPLGGGEPKDAVHINDIRRWTQGMQNPNPAFFDESYAAEGRFAYSVRRKDGADSASGVGAAIIKDLEKQMSQDIIIWEHKKYYQKPLLCDGDGPFGDYRRWMSQFFTKPSA